MFTGIQKAEECFDHWTLVVGNIPNWCSVDEVLHTFRSFGNIVRIEMPHRDINIDALAQKQAEYIA